MEQLAVPVAYLHTIHLLIISWSVGLYTVQFSLVHSPLNQKHNN